MLIIITAVVACNFAFAQQGLEYNTPFESLEQVSSIGGYYSKSIRDKNIDDYCYGDKTKIFYKNDKGKTVNDSFYKRGAETTYSFWKKNKDGWSEITPTKIEIANYDTRNVIKGCNKTVILYKLKSTAADKVAADKAAADKAAADKAAADKAAADKAAADKAAADKAAADKAAADKAAKKKEADDKKLAEEQAQIDAQKRIDDLEKQIQALKDENSKKNDAKIAELEKKITKINQDNDSNTIIYVLIALIIAALLVFLFLRKNKNSNKMNTVVQPQNTDILQPIVVKPETVTPQQQIVIPPTPQPTPVTPITPPTPQPQSKPKVQADPIVAFAKDADQWIVVGASVVGNGHISMNLPCQDSHKYEYLGESWGIAVSSDGAGSAQNSQIGSKIVAERCIFHFKDLITKRNWIKKNELPSETEWSEISKALLKSVRNDMEAFAKSKNIELKSLSATAIVVIHTPDGILATHIGDGRAGYKNQNGEWKALITPHKGDEANQTIFVPSEFWDIPAYKMSGVLVPESVVVKEKPFAFTLMSDGCESTSWLYSQKDEATGKFFDPNKPYPNFFNPLSDTLQSFRKDKVEEKERAEKWGNFIKDGNKSFEREQDDKTMILGVMYM